MTSNLEVPLCPLSLVTGGVGFPGVDLPLIKQIHFYLGPWLLVCQFIEISNETELNGEVSNTIEYCFFVHLALQKVYLPDLEEGGFTPVPASRATTACN